MTLISSYSFAQFKASVNGVVTENGESFYVANVEGKTAQQIYDAVNSWLTANSKNPDAVLTKEEGKTIKIQCIFPNAVTVGKRLGIKDVADVELELMMYFKDNKIRFDLPIVNKMKVHPKDTELFFSGAFLNGINMFKKDGKENKPEIIKSFNTFINNLIETIVNKAKEGNDNW